MALLLDELVRTCRWHTHAWHSTSLPPKFQMPGSCHDAVHSRVLTALPGCRACDPLKKPLGDADKVIMPGKQDKGAKSPEKKSEAAKSPEKKTEAAKSPEKAKSPSKASPEKKSEKAASPEKKPSSPTKRKQDEAKAENGKEDAKKQKTDA